MDNAEARRRFNKADKLFTYGRYDDVLVELDALDTHFPDNHRLLNAKARTLERLGRFEEALVVCDRLLNEFHYEKIRPFRDGVAHSLRNRDSAPQNAFWGNETGAVMPPPPPPGASAPGPAPEKSKGGGKRIRRVLFRITMVAIPAALVYWGHIPTWLGGGIIVIYLLMLLAVFVVKRALMRLFTAPFKMKGKALAGAQCELHGFQWTTRPPEVEPDEPDEDDVPRAPGRFVWLDVTIAPQPQTGGFTHWEPGELMLAPLAMEFKGMDDLDRCFPIHDYKLPQAAGGRDGDEDDDDPSKFVGPLRLKLLAEVPEGENAFKFVYYFEQFGEIRLG